MAKFVKEAKEGNNDIFNQFYKALEENTNIGNPTDEEFIGTENILRIDFWTPLTGISAMMVGIDPGTVNLGIAILEIPTIKGDVYQAQLYQVKLPNVPIDAMVD